MKKIYLHIGHGGSDSGAVGSVAKEKDITLKIGTLTYYELIKQGYDVIMSRNSDVSNQNASKTANSWGAQLVISIHCNSYTDQSASGTEVLIYKRGGQAEKFASILLPYAVKALASKNRGVKEQNVEILRNTNAPAVLLETGFVSNKAEEFKLIDSVYQQKIAEAIAKAVCEYYGKEYVDMDYQGHWAEKYIERVMDEGIMVGDGDGNFRPDDNLTRAEAAVIICKILDLI